MTNKPSPLREEQLVGMNHIFSSTRDNEQCINSSLLKWFLKNAFLQNMLGNVSLCTGGHTSTSCRSCMFPLVHKQKKNSCEKTKHYVYTFFCSPWLKWHNRNNKLFYIRRSLPSDLILNTSFLSTESKAANTVALKSQHRSRERPSYPSHYWLLPGCKSTSAEWRWTECPLSSPRKDPRCQVSVSRPKPELLQFLTFV